MTTRLAPVVAERLRQFRQRRVFLSTLRAISMAVFCVVAGLAVVAAVDWYWLIDDSIRWTLSGLVYLTAAVVACWGLAGSTIARSKEEDAALQIEAAGGSDDVLLSAVELATDSPEEIHDSPAFREVLQQQAAAKAEALQLGELLPFRLVLRSVTVASVTVALAALILISGGPRVRQLATRAALPGANVARVSRVQIEIVEPAPANVTVPTNDTVAIVVSVSGDDVDEVLLETSIASEDGNSKQTMWRQDAELFAANVAADATRTRYRVRAGDAITEWFQIESKPRPRVLGFAKDFTYPRYSQKSPVTIESTDGNIVDLEGSRVGLTLEIDQPTEKAELHFTDNTSGDLRVIPLREVPEEPQHDGRVRMATDLVLNTPGFYQVVLVGKETGFSNQFSPRYQFQPVEDQSPRVEFVDQSAEEILLSPNDLVGLQGVAEDDLPINDVEQQVAVNGGEWLTLRLDGTTVPPDVDANVNARHRYTADWQWDLLNYNLRPGDHVTTKLVATDLNGSVGESQPLHIVIAGTDFDPERHEVATAKLSFVDTLDAYALAFEERAVELEKTIESLDQNDDQDETLARLGELLVEQKNDTDEIVTSVHELLPELPAGIDSEDVMLLGRVLLRVQSDELAESQFLLSTVMSQRDSNADDSAEFDRPGTLARIGKTFLATAKTVRASALNYRTLATHNFHQALSGDLDALATQQSLVARLESSSLDRVQRQQTLVINQLRSISSFVRNHRGHVRRQTAQRLGDYLRWLAEEELRLSSALNEENDDRQASALSQLGREMLSRTEPRSNIHNLDSGLPHDLGRAHDDLRSRAGWVYESIRDLASRTATAEKESQELIDAKDSDEAAEVGRTIDQLRREVDRWHQPRIGQLRSRRELTQSRVDADSQFAADAGLTSRALTSLISQWQTSLETVNNIEAEETAPDAIRQVADAFRILEAAHDLARTARGLSKLSNGERWNSQTVAARFDHPRLFHYWEKMVERTARALREADVRHEAVGQLDALRWSEPSGIARKKIVERLWRPEDLVSAYVQTASLENRLADVRTDLQPVFDEARAVIARFAPTLPEMLQAAAEQARETESAAEAVQQAAASENASEQKLEAAVAELQQQQDQTNAQLADVVEALTEEANKQDLWDDDQRAIARDADDSIEMLREPAARANSAMQEATEPTSPAARESALADVSEAQSDTAEALETIAEHFEALANGEDLADTRQQLRAAEQELGVARQMEQRYEPTANTDSDNAMSPQERLAELERELADNPEMQTALEEITQQTIAEAQNALTRAANDDNQIQRDNERSDADFRERKQQAASELRELANDASRLANALVNEARQAASRGRADDAVESLESARQSLDEAANTARRISDDAPLRQIQEATNDVAEALASASEQLNSAADATKAASNENIHNDENTVAKRQQEEQKSQQQFLERQRRDANNEAKRADDQKRQKEKALNNAQRAALAADRKVTDAARNARQRLDDKGRQRRLQQEKTRLEQAQAKLETANEQFQAAEATAAEKRAKADELAATSLDELDAINPAAQLANRYSEQAEETTRSLQQQVENLKQQMDFGDTLLPSANQLAASEQRQNQISEELEDVAARLERAARHEARLNKSQVAEALSERAEEVANVAAEESAQASKSLADAAEAAKSSNDANAGEAASQQAVEAQQQTAASESAIANQADALASFTEAMSDQSSDSPLAESSPSSSNGSAEQSGTQQASAAQSQAAANPPNAQSSTPTSGTQPQSSPSSSSAQANAQQATPTSPSPQQLAMALDELDRMIAAGDPSESSAATDQLATAAAQAQQASSASDRVATQRQTIASFSPSSNPADGPTTPPGDDGPFTLNEVARGTGSDWGTLRSKTADDVTAQSTTTVSEKYRSRVEAYFRALAERSRAAK